MAKILLFPYDRSQGADPPASSEGLQAVVQQSEILAMCLQRLIEHTQRAQAVFSTYEAEREAAASANEYTQRSNILVHET